MILKTTNGIPYTVTVSKSGIIIRLHVVKEKDTLSDIDKAKLWLKHSSEGIKTLVVWGNEEKFHITKQVKQPRITNIDSEIVLWKKVIEDLKEENLKLRNRLENQKEPQFYGIDKSFECQTCGNKTLCNDKGETITL